jgi:uncharacterized protein
VAGRLVVVRDGDEEYRFRIEAEDGQLMATSEPYTSKSSALKGVEAIKRMPPTPKSTTSRAMTRPPRPPPGWPPQTPSLSCPRVVATHQRFLCHSLAFPRTSSGVRPLVQRPVWARSVL